MNQMIIDEIRAKGERLGRGASRTAYLYNEKVYKLENVGRLFFLPQSLSESKAIDMLIEKFGKLDLMPQSGIVGEDIITMELVPTIAEDDEGFSEFCYDNNRNYRISDFFDYCKKCKPDFKHDHFIEEFEKIRPFINDVFNNTGNFGYCNGYIKVVDFGLNAESDDFVESHRCSCTVCQRNRGYY